jgi:chemotaxis protein MotA
MIHQNYFSELQYKSLAVVRTQCCLYVAYGRMTRMDIASVIGILIGFGAIILGNTIEGGHLSSLLQATAALIVIGGTVGATMVSSSSDDLSRAMALLKKAFRSKKKRSLRKDILEIVDCARSAKKESMMTLEPKLKNISDPFVARVLRNIIDGIKIETVKEIAEIELSALEANELRAVKVWSDAAGFAPTIGIIGAVLGLIHVMGNLSDTSKLGGGIAVAFVATVYGVGLSNLILLPVANKLKKIVQKNIDERLVLLEGCLLVGTELNPIVVERKMMAAIDFEQSLEA